MENKEVIILYKLSPEAIKKRVEYKKQNPEIVKKANQNYYQKNKEKILEKKKQKYIEKKELLQESNI